MEPYIFNIQKFSLHDGPGIRTTVFFKGCPLRCRWCHNPESQSYEPEWMDGRQAGVRYPVEELVRLLKKDELFYDQSGGGVTLSGGEVLAQDADYVLTLVKGLKREGISVVIDTCGQAPRELLEQILPYTDLFLYDLKLMDEKKHQIYTGVSNRQILDNLLFLSEQGARIELRIPLICGVNTGEEEIRSIVCFLTENKVRAEKITLLTYHDLGREKYAKLLRECTQNFSKPDEEQRKRARALLENGGFSVEEQ